MSAEMKRTSSSKSEWPVSLYWNEILSINTGICAAEFNEGRLNFRVVRFFTPTTATAPSPLSAIPS